MKIFKDIIEIVNRTFGVFCLGSGIGNMFREQYELAAYFLFAVSILYSVGYFVERWSE